MTTIILGEPELDFLMRATDSYRPRTGFDLEVKRAVESLLRTARASQVSTQGKSESTQPDTDTKS